MGHLPLAGARPDYTWSIITSQPAGELVNTPDHHFQLTGVAQPMAPICWYRVVAHQNSGIAPSHEHAKLSISSVVALAHFADGKRSSQSQHQVPRFCLRGPNLDFYVVTQSGEAVHQFALRQIREVTTHHVGNPGLGDAHAFCHHLLSHAQAADGFSDLDHQARF
jgi:hypothetical protein